MAVSFRERRRRSRRSWRHSRRGKSEIAMSPLTGHREKARRGQLCEMGAGRLRRDSRRDGELACGEGTAIEKRPHHRSSRRVREQRRDLGDDRACDHSRLLTGRKHEDSSHINKIQPRRQGVRPGPAVYFWTSSLTLAFPVFVKPSSSAARRVTSITAGFVAFIRSLTVTTTLLPMSTLVTFTLVPKGSFLCDAVRAFLS